MQDIPCYLNILLKPTMKFAKTNKKNYNNVRNEFIRDRNTNIKFTINMNPNVRCIIYLSSHKHEQKTSTHEGNKNKNSKLVESVSFIRFFRFLKTRC